MAFHTLAEFVATILITLIAAGGVFGGMFVYYKLRAKELEAEDSRDAEVLLGAVEARLRMMETRLGATERAIDASLAGLPQRPQALDASVRTPSIAEAAEKLG